MLVKSSHLSTYEAATKEKEDIQHQSINDQLGQLNIVSASPLRDASDESVCSIDLGGKAETHVVPITTEKIRSGSPSDIELMLDVAAEQSMVSMVNEVQNKQCRLRLQNNQRWAHHESQRTRPNFVKRWVPKAAAEAYQSSMASKVKLTRTQKRRIQRRRNQQYWNSYHEEQKSLELMKSRIQWITMWVPKGKVTSTDVVKQSAIKFQKGCGAVAYAGQNAKNQLTRTQKRRLYRQRAACKIKNTNSQSTSVQASLVKQIWIPKIKSGTISDKVDSVVDITSTLQHGQVHKDEMQHVEGNIDKSTDSTNEVMTGDDDESDCTSVGCEELVDVIQHPPFSTWSTYINPLFTSELQHEQVFIPQGPTMIDTSIPVQHVWSADAADSIEEAVLGLSYPTSISTSSMSSMNWALTGTPLPM